MPDKEVGLDDLLEGSAHAGKKFVEDAASTLLWILVGALLLMAVIFGALGHFATKWGWL